MTKRSFSKLLVLSGISITVLIAIQYQWFTKAYRLKEIEFDEKVNKALNDAMTDLEKRDAAATVTKFISRTGRVPESARRLLPLRDALPRRKVVTGKDTIPPPGYRNSNEPDPLRLRDSLFKLNSIVWQVVTEYSSGNIPVAEKLRQINFDSLVSIHFKKNNIEADFRYAIISSYNDSSYTVRRSNLLNDKSNVQEYSVKIFPSFLFPENNVLKVQVLDRNRIIRNSLIYFFIIALLIFLVILLTLGISITTILKQKKLSQIQKDFINNVTHELKTPIASIGLAANSILNEKVISDAKQIRFYAERIVRENDRMDTKIDNILLTSVSEGEELQLVKSDTDVHHLLFAALEQIKVQLDKQQSKLELYLDAKHVTLKIDKEHMQNVFVNLLDNAIKYVKDAPEIEIKTFDSNGYLHIIISDKGIGISKEDQKYIFKKFFRASTGNTQETKGFGIGLSYVYNIIAAHNGKINVKSELGKGTTFTIKLPNQ